MDDTKKLKVEDIIQVRDLKFQPFITEAMLQKRIKEMGSGLSASFQGKKPLIIGVLNGAYVFMADLARACDFDCELSFIKLSSYSGTKSTGKIQTMIGLEAELKDRHVIVVEDIVDTGKTISEFLKLLESKSPASITMVALLVKPDAIEYKFDIDYVGFEIENKFVVGYGLDYDGYGRNYAAIYQLLEEK